MQHYREQALVYVSAMNEYFESSCPAAFDAEISEQANREVALRYQLHLPADMPAGNPLGQRPSGKPLDLRREFQRRLQDSEDGKKDGEILYAHAPFKCDSGIVVKVHKGMAAFVGLN